ncbi:hypothetical protein PLICRDRAFT_34633 [Plicaturopsis crispa FD-325 SS-3]|nr:hypothetical protein PLICRDRAFT_34633 [Plicaturopsis crispa FD-325 SS-3]
MFAGQGLEAPLRRQQGMFRKYRSGRFFAWVTYAVKVAGLFPALSMISEQESRWSSESR